MMTIRLILATTRLRTMATLLRLVIPRHVIATVLAMALSGKA